LVGSPAIDNASAAVCAAAPVGGVDQRGVSRPQGAGCDIGAYELQVVTATLIPGVPQADVGGVTYVAAGTPLTLSGSGAGSVAYCVFPQGGSCAAGFTNVSGASATFTLGSGRTDGAYTVAYYAGDALGNRGATQTTNLTLDATPPTATLSIGQPQATVNGQAEVTGQTPLTLQASDGGSGVASVAYRYFPRGKTAPGYTTVNGGSASFTLSGADGAYEVDYAATDHVGNRLAKTLFVTLRDATAPVGTTGTPAPGTTSGATGTPALGATGTPRGTTISAGNPGQPQPEPGAHQTSAGPPVALVVGLVALLLLAAGVGVAFYLHAPRAGRNGDAGQEGDPSRLH
jgi:hypothetical protein